MASDLSNARKVWTVLTVSTLAFTVCCMVLVMFGVIDIPLKKMLHLNATEFGLLTATPVLTGSLIRVPQGIWTVRFGASHRHGPKDRHQRAWHMDDFLGAVLP